MFCIVDITFSLSSTLLNNNHDIYDCMEFSLSLLYLHNSHRFILGSSLTVLSILRILHALFILMVLATPIRSTRSCKQKAIEILVILSLAHKFFEPKAVQTGKPQEVNNQSQVHNQVSIRKCYMGNTWDKATDRFIIYHNQKAKQ